MRGPCSPAHHIRRPDCGNIALRPTHVGGGGRRAVFPPARCANAAQPSAGSPARPAFSPSPGVRNGPADTLPGRRPGPRSARPRRPRYAPREMYAQKRVPRIRDRIDKAAYEILFFSGTTSMYSPRKGTMRGRGSPPARPATVSACNPAQRTTRSACSTCSPTPISIPEAVRGIRSTGDEVLTSPPAATTSAANASATWRKSVIPVRGEYSAAILSANGSISRIPAASTRRNCVPPAPPGHPGHPGHPGLAISSSSTAITSLPHSSYGKLRLHSSRAAWPAPARTALLSNSRG